MHYVMLNGALQAQAAVSVSDRSFRYGDGLFETIPFYCGLPYLWDYHMERLAGGLEALCIQHSIEGLLHQALALIKANALQEGLLRIHISRGTGGRGYLPSPDVSATVVIETLQRPAPSPEPLTLWLSAYEKISPRALPTHCKLAQGLNSTLARLEAKRHDCHEALQLGEGGVIAEAASANILWLEDHILYTPSLATGALAGVTRRRLMELSPYPVREGVFHLRDMEKADAVMLTNAASGVMAVAHLLPQEMHWEVNQHINNINLLIKQDINRNIIALRESLA